MPTTVNIKTLAIVLAASMLSACGGGGGGGDSASDGSGGGTGDGSTGGDSPSTEYGTAKDGWLLDGSITGLTYATGDIESTVDEGKLQYYTESAVTVTLGQSVIGTSDGGLVIPFGGLEKGLSSVNADYWDNVGVLLIMADDDADATNGIAITGATRSAAESYQLDFNTDYNTFIDTNSSALSAIASATSAGDRAVPSEGAANTWVADIEDVLNNGLAISQGYFTVYSEEVGFEGALELNSDGSGQVDTSSTGGVGSYRAGDAFEPMTDWGVANGDFSGVRGFYFTTQFDDWKCFALDVDSNVTKAACDIGDDSRVFYLADYMALYKGDPHTLGELDSQSQSLFDDMGSYFPVTAANNVYVDDFAFIPGGGTHADAGTGSWTSAGTTFDVSASAEDRLVTITDEVGPHAVIIEETNAATSNSVLRLVTVAGLALKTSDVSDKFYVRYDMSDRSEIEQIGLNGDNSTYETGVTWSIADSGRRLNLTGAEYDRCTYAGKVGKDLFMVCDDSSGASGPARLEYWRHDY